MENLFKNSNNKNVMKIRPLGFTVFHTHKQDEASSRFSILTTTTTTTTTTTFFYKMYSPFFM